MLSINFKAIFIKKTKNKKKRKRTLLKRVDKIFNAKEINLQDSLNFIHKSTIKKNS